MEAGLNSPGNVLEGRQRRAIDWMPLLIVLVAVALAGLSISNMLYLYANGSYYFSPYKLESEIGAVAGLLSFTASLAAIAYILYSREGHAKLSLMVAITLNILLVVLRTEIVLRLLTA